MRVEALRVSLRGRRGFEAVDLGLCMARAWWRPLALTWVVFVVPVALAIVLALVAWPLLAVLLLWWLRPAFARIPLHVLSRRLFGEEVGVAETARSLPALARSGLWTSLFLQRLSPARSFLQPVVQLEGLRGQARRERCAVLSREDVAASAGLLVFGAHANLVIQLGLLMSIGLLLPDEVVFEPQAYYLGSWFDAEWTWIDAIVPGMYLLGISVVEPLVAAGGFGLYVSRRVYLEGWDIELVFRGLAAREPVPGAGRAVGVGRAVALGVALVLLGSGSAEAQGESDWVCRPSQPLSAEACLAELLASPDFAETRLEERWVLKESDSGDDPEEGAFEFEWLGALLAALGRAALWVGLGVLVWMVVRAILQRLPEAPHSRAPARSPGSSGPMGFDLDPRALPDDPSARARELFAAGDAIQALSLLYRVVLVDLAERRALTLPDSATEFECLRAVEQTQVADRVHDFRELTRQWMSARYAGVAPGADEFEQLCLRVDLGLAAAG